MQDCIFCKIVSQDIPAKIIRETDQLLVLQDIAPKAPIHYLIVPKKHVQDLASCSSDDQSMLSEILSMSQTLSREVEGASSFKFLTNNGHAAGQRVFHLHFHFLAGKTFSE